MLVAGLVVLLVAGGLFYAATRQRARAEASLATSTTGCGELVMLAAAVATEIDDTPFRQQVELAGTAGAGPRGALEGPLSTRAVVWWRTLVEREYEEDEWTTDSQGKRRREVVRRTETVSEESSNQAFSLTDSTGSVLIDPMGMPIDRPVETHDERRPPEAGGGLAAAVSRMASDTIAFRHREWAIPVGEALYVLGEARSSPGELAADGLASGGILVGKPADRGARATISTRTEAEIVKSSTSLARGLAIGSIAAAALGAVLIVAGLAS